MSKFFVVYIKFDLILLDCLVLTLFLLQLLFIFNLLPLVCIVELGSFMHNKSIQFFDLYLKKRGKAKLIKVHPEKVIKSFSRVYRLTFSVFICS